MKPAAQREPGLIARCTCGHGITLARELLDRPGQEVACPKCGTEKRVWQWVASVNRREATS